MNHRSTYSYSFFFLVNTFCNKIPWLLWIYEQIPAHMISETTAVVMNFDKINTSSWTTNLLWALVISMRIIKLIWNTYCENGKHLINLNASIIQGSWHIDSYMLLNLKVELIIYKIWYYKICLYSICWGTVDYLIEW